jgi:hypothetical protein
MALISVGFQLFRVDIVFNWMERLTIKGNSATGGVPMKVVPPRAIIVVWTEVMLAFTEKVP